MKQSKKVIAAALSLTMGCTSIGTGLIASAANYPDTENHWAQSPVDYWSSRNVLSGYEDGTFRPDDTISRGEIAAVLSRMIGLEEKAENTFADLDSSAWYADSVLKAAKAGLICGDDNGNANAESAASRQEAASLFARAFRVEDAADSVNGYSDAADVSAWAQGSVGGVTAAGYMTGDNGQFRPLDTITRAEFVALLSQSVAAYITEPGTYTAEDIPADKKGVIVVAASDVRLDGVTADYALISPLAANVEIYNSAITRGVTNLSAKEVKTDGSVKIIGNDLIPTETKAPAVTEKPDATDAPDSTAKPQATTKPTSKPSTSGGGGRGSITKYTVTLNANGGVFADDKAVSTVKIAKNKVLGTVTEPTREGYNFTGWYTDEACTEKWDADTKITKSVTLYAGWKETETQPTVKESTAEFAKLEDTTDVFDKKASDLATGLTFVPDTEATTIKATGTVKYLADWTSVYGANSAGNYLPFRVSGLNANAVVYLESDVDYTNTIDGKNYKKVTSEQFDDTANKTYVDFVRKVANSNASFTVVVDLDGDGTEYTQTVYTIDVSGLTLETAQPTVKASTAEFAKLEDTTDVFDKKASELATGLTFVADTEATTIKAAGTVKYLADWTAVYGANSEGNYLPFRVSGLNANAVVYLESDVDYTNTIDGKNYKKVTSEQFDDTANKTYVDFVRKVANSNASFTVVVDLDGEGTEYTQTVYTIDVSGLTLETAQPTVKASTAEFAKLEDTTDVFDKKASDLAADLTFVPDTEATTIKAAGTVKYLADWTSVYGANSAGNYLPFRVSGLNANAVVYLESDVDYTDTINGKHYKKVTSEQFDDTANKTYVDFVRKVANSNASFTVVVDLDGDGTEYTQTVYTIDVSGLTLETAQPTVKASTAEFAKLEDTTDVFDKKASDLAADLTFVPDTEATTIKAAGTVKYLADWTAVYGENSAGNYLPFRVSGLNANAVVYLESDVDYTDTIGEKHYKKVTSNQFDDAVNKTYVDFVRKVADSNASFTVVVDLDGEGTEYTQTVYTIDVSGLTLETAQPTVKASTAEFAKIEDTTDVFDKKASDLATGLTFVPDTEATTIKATGTVKYLEDWTSVYGANSAGNYLPFRVSGLNANAVVYLESDVDYTDTINGKHYKKVTSEQFDDTANKTYVDFVRKVADSNASFTVVVDLDGEGTEYTQTVYTIDVSGLALGTAQPTAKESTAEFAKLEDTAGVFDKKASDLATGLTFVPDTEATTIKAAGTVKYLADWTSVYGANSAGNYLPFRVSGLNANAVVYLESDVDYTDTINGKHYKKVTSNQFDDTANKTYVDFVRKVANSNASFTVVADLDGEGTEYTQTVYTIDVSGLALGTAQPTAKESTAEFAKLEDTAGVFDKKASDLATGLTFVPDTEATTIKATGTVKYLEDWTSVYGANSASNYLPFRVSGLNANAVVYLESDVDYTDTINGKHYKKVTSEQFDDTANKTYVDFVRKVADSNASFTVVVDLDGDGTEYAQTVYTIDVSGLTLNLPESEVATNSDTLSAGATAVLRKNLTDFGTFTETAYTLNGVNTIKVDGTLTKVTDFDAFSAGASGYFVPAAIMGMNYQSLFYIEHGTTEPSQAEKDAHIYVQDSSDVWYKVYAFNTENQSEAVDMMFVDKLGEVSDTSPTKTQTRVGVVSTVNDIIAETTKEQLTTLAQTNLSNFDREYVLDYSGVTFETAQP